MASVKLLLNKSRALRDGSYPLVFQLIYQRKKKLIYTSYKLYPEEFDTDKEKVCYISGARFSLRKVRAMNNMIALQRSEIERCIKKFECCKREYSVQDIVARYRAMHDDYNLLHYIDRCIERKRAMKRFGTAAAYQSTRNSLALFTKEKGVCFSGIDNIFQRDYTEFLLKRGVSNNTVCFYIRNLKSLCNQAVKEGYRLAEKSPFENVYVRPRKTVKRAQDRETIRKIYEFDFSAKPHVELARDLFIFSFFSRGMPFVDILLLKKTNIFGNTIVYSRHKIGQPLRILLTSQLRSLIAKYDNDSDYLFPILRDSDPIELYGQYRRALERTNRNLKTVARVLGITGGLSTYVARHSWATQAKKSGAPVALISEGLGHTSERTTQIYLKELDQNIVDRLNARVSAL